MEIHWCEVFMVVPMVLGVGVLLFSLVTTKKPPAGNRSQASDKRSEIAAAKTLDEVAAPIIL